MVHDIEKFGSKLRVHLFADCRVLHERKIEVAVVGTDHDVAPRIAEGERSVENESAGIEPLLNRMRSGVRIARHRGYG